MAIKKILKNFVIASIVSIFIFLPFFVFAENLSNAFTAGSAGFLGKAAEKAGYTEGNDIWTLISTIITIALSFLGVIFLVLMIYGGYLWMTAGGNEDQVTKAKDLIKAAIIGLIIVVSAYAISYFVMSKLGGTTLK